MGKHMLGLVLSLFILRSSIEDFIDGIFPNETLRIAIGIGGVLFFGYHAIVVQNGWKRWFTK